MKQNSFASPALFRAVAMNSACAFFEELIIVLVFIHGKWWGVMPAFLLLEAFAVFPLLWKYRNALCRVQMDETGIYTKHMKIAWQDINSYDLCNVYWYRWGYHHPRFKRTLPSVVCIGHKKKSDLFIRQDMKKCVCFSLIPSHLAMLAHYGAGKSKIADEILRYYGNIANNITEPRIAQGDQDEK